MNMSYDISIANREFNYTYNLSEFFNAHLPDGLRTLGGMTGREAGDALADAFESINEERMCVYDLGKHRVEEEKLRERYDSPNGWGTYEGALVFLGELMAACYRNPRHKVHVC